MAKYKVVLSIDDYLALEEGSIVIQGDAEVVLSSQALLELEVGRTEDRRIEAETH